MTGLDWSGCLCSFCLVTVYLTVSSEYEPGAPHWYFGYGARTPPSSCEKPPCAAFCITGDCRAHEKGRMQPHHRVHFLDPPPFRFYSFSITAIMRACFSMTSTPCHPAGRPHKTIYSKHSEICPLLCSSPGAIPRHAINGACSALSG
jgi:hypothetical protein